MVSIEIKALCVSMQCQRKRLMGWEARPIIPDCQPAYTATRRPTQLVVTFVEVYSLFALNVVSSL